MLTEKIYSTHISIVGAGNMAWHLAHCFSNAGIGIEYIINRNRDKGLELAIQTGAQYSDNFHTLFESSTVLLIAVSDSAIEETLQRLSSDQLILVHTSGTVNIDILKRKSVRCGVIYPFQTLTRGVVTDLMHVPVFIEASDDVTLNAIQILAEKISQHVVLMSSEQRQKLHMAGVLINNFTNHLSALAFDYMNKNKINPEYAIPLLRETIRKIEAVGPRESQTGPARRNNSEVINKHLELLADELPLKNLYKVISDSIIAYYSK